ncbi:MAG: hypothetical protein RL344_816 [Pseudomonadota bacterium]
MTIIFILDLFLTKTPISATIVTYIFGSLAQLVEQRTFNPLVACSSHARPTKN